MFSTEAGAVFAAQPMGRFTIPMSARLKQPITQREA